MKKIEFINQNDSKYNFTATTELNTFTVPTVKKGDYKIVVTSDSHEKTSVEITVNDDVKINIILIKVAPTVPPAIEIVTDDTPTADGYGSLEVTVIESGEVVEGEPVITWQAKTTTQPVSYTTLPDVENPNLDEGIRRLKVKGVNGERTIITEYEYSDGVATGNSRVISNKITTPAINEQYEIGTKEVTTVDSANILTQSNVAVGGATNTFVNGTRTANDAIPLDKTFELRQWAEPAGAMSVKAGDLQDVTDYTLSFSMRNRGSAIENAWFVIGTSFFGGKHFINGSEIAIEPNSGQYPFTSEFLNDGTYMHYKYQFTTSNFNPSDYFQVAFDNAKNNTNIEISNLKLVEGVV